MDLQKEYKYYLSLDDKFKKENFGKYVIIKDQKVVGVFESYKDALQIAIEKFGEKGYLIHQVLQEQQIQYNTFSLLGLV